MSEKSNIEILSEFAKSTNRSIEFKETAYPTSGIRKIPKYKRWVYMPNNSRKTSFFIWFGDPYARIGIPTNFCGAFIPLPSKYKEKISIRKKYTLDKLNVFSKTNGIGHEEFDAKMIINGTPGVEEQRFLSSSRIQYDILKALEIESFINISINEFKLDFVPELKGQSYLSIINPHSWNLERDFIEAVFRQIEKIRDDID